jgi:hypothetical protein
MQNSDSFSTIETNYAKSLNCVVHIPETSYIVIACNLKELNIWDYKTKELV